MFHLIIFAKPFGLVMELTKAEGKTPYRPDSTASSAYVSLLPTTPVPVNRTFAGEQGCEFIERYFGRSKASNDVKICCCKAWLHWGGTKRLEHWACSSSLARTISWRGCRPPNPKKRCAEELAGSKLSDLVASTRDRCSKSKILIDPPEADVAHRQIFIQQKTRTVDGTVVVERDRAFHVRQRFYRPVFGLFTDGIVELRCWVGLIQGLGDRERFSGYPASVLFIVGFAQIAAHQAVARIKPRGNLKFSTPPFMSFRRMRASPRPRRDCGSVVSDSISPSERRLGCCRVHCRQLREAQHELCAGQVRRDLLGTTCRLQATAGDIPVTARVRPTAPRRARCRDCAPAPPIPRRALPQAGSSPARRRTGRPVRNPTRDPASPPGWHRQAPGRGRSTRPL